MNDNVIPMENGAPPKPKRLRKGKAGLEFSDDANATAFQAFTGLKGICRVMDSLEGTEAEVGLYVQLSMASALLVDLLEEREL